MELYLNNTQSTSGVDSDYNLYYRTSNTLRIIYKGGGTAYHMNDIALIRSALGYEINSPTPANPSFLNAPTTFALASGSPAIGAGVAIATDAYFDGLDYTGTAYANPPSLGAIEYDTSPPTTTTANIEWYPEDLNIKSFLVSGDYVTFKFYQSSANRIAETGAVHTFTAPITYSTITPLAGHTRTTTQKPSATQTVTVTGIPITYATLYMDTYISNASGTRLINLGTKANGYTTITIGA
jgi:hypothetical protein